MNEELFQHWMALKDIKILTNRLGNYAQIKKIYEDLMFNDQLFHWIINNISLLLHKLEMVKCNKEFARSQ
jgi:hypothetical protein